MVVAGCGGSGSAHLPTGGGSTPAVASLTADGASIDMTAHQIVAYGYVSQQSYTVEYNDAFEISVHDGGVVTPMPATIQNSETVLNNPVAVEGAWIAGLYTDGTGTHSYAWNWQTGALYSLDHANVESISSDGSTLYYQGFGDDNTTLLGHFRMNLATGAKSGPLSDALNTLTIARSSASGSLLLYSVPPAAPMAVTKAARLKPAIKPTLKSRARDGERVLYFLWNGSSAVELQPLSGDTDMTAFDIDATNNIVGQSVSATGVQHPVLWKGVGAATALTIPSGYDQGSAESISSEGIIGGILFKGEAITGVLWSGASLEAKTIDALVGNTGGLHYQDATLDHNSKKLHSADYDANVVQFFTAN